MDSLSELRIRVGTVEIAVVGTSREDCLRQLDAAAREVEHREEARWLVTAEGRAALRSERSLEPEDFFHPSGPFATEAELRAAIAAEEAQEAAGEAEFDGWDARWAR